MAISKRLLADARFVCGIGIGLLLFSSGAGAQQVTPCPTPSICQRAMTAKVVVIDQVLTFNRLGSEFKSGMIFALKRDVVSTANGKSCDQADANCTPGKVKLRDDKRPRPIVLRVNLGDCLDIELTNLLKDTPPADLHIMGLELRTNIKSDASWVGRNNSSLTPPTATYHYFVKEEGTFFLYSQDDGTGGQQQSGLFGSVIVEPEGAEYYRSQVTKDVLDKATYHPGPGQPIYSPSMSRMLSGVAPVNGQYLTPDKHPIINYAAVDQDGTPLLQMTRSINSTAVPPQLELIATDLTAIITGPQAGWFPNNNCSPTFITNGITYPERRRPYREFSIHYHNMQTAVDPFQSFGQGLAANMNSVLQAGNDQFGINYGIAGIGPEVLANRLGVGPEAGCVECKFEEFFLSAWTVGDPAMVVDVPANSPSGKATKVFYPDDPSNVYHSYLRDHVKFRIHNAATQAHVHHQHAHQWLHTPDDDNSEYLDSQMIVPGSSYTLEIAYGGSGNRNLTAGDSIFHCHFYPHFAQGMWSLWRVHDTFEAGTELKGGIPVGDARALPDGEITAGTPIPAVVPLPAQAMAPLPAKIRLSKDGRRVDEVLPDADGKVRNPGYPFFVPGVAGHRPPHPPCDFAWEGGDQQDSLCEKPATVRNYYDGGLPRHLVLGGEVVREFHTRWDFTKDFIRYDDKDKPVAGNLKAFQLPEEGTLVERAAMTQHSSCDIPSFLPDGKPGNFRMNGLPGVPGAPYANPDSDPNCNASHYQVRRYKAAVLQTDTVLNKKGWHSPQQRMITLWGDVLPTLQGTRPPQPFFFRSNSAESIEFWHTNLVPSYYELDDFQVRTPTDILGQHIHLVKFDVLASDGAANGFNYEDGTLSPDDVRDRIQAVNRMNGLYAFDPKTQFIDPNPSNQTQLSPKAPPKEICGDPGKSCPAEWTGAQATIQRWSSDTLLNNSGVDRTLRTVFTHDHFGPSTHQQVGLYAGLLVEPSCSRWFDPVTGEQMYTRPDGGPTSWQAMIATYKNCPEGGGGPDGSVLDSYREFALEFQDVQLAYTRNSIFKPAAEQFSHSVLFSNVFSATDWTVVLADLNSGKVNPLLATQFAQNGIVFPATQAQVTALTPKKVWDVQVTDPAHPQQPDKRQKYRVELTQKTGVNVFSNNIVPGWTSSAYAISPPGDGNGSNNVPNGPPYPTLVSTAGNVGTYSLSYRSEPIPTRVDPNPPSKDPLTGNAAQQAGDLSYVFQSIERFDKDLNQQPTPGAPIDSGQPHGFTFPAILTPGMQPFDPYTPLLRAYQNDRVQIRTLVGAHINGHSFQGFGFKWPFEPRADWMAGSSGYRSAQGMGLSEHFEMLFKVPPSPASAPADYLYEASSEFAGLENGLWGMLRAYNGGGGASLQPDLKALPTNLAGSGVPPPTCPPNAKPNVFDVVAVNAGKALPGGQLVYNSRAASSGDADPDAVLYVQAGDLNSDGTLKTGVPIEPLILRANAGDCIEIHVTSQLTGAQVTNAVPPNSPQPFTPNPTLFSTEVSAQTTTAYTAALNKGTVPTGLTNTFKGFGFPLTNPTVQQVSEGNWTITSGNILYSVGLSKNTFKVNTTPVAPFVSLATPVSTTAGLHAQLVSYDVTQSNGLNVGFNPPQTTVPGQPGKVYRWYAGDIQIKADGPHWIPVELGSIPLTPADPLIQRERGLIGALIIEPQGSKPPVLDPNTRAAATITKEDGTTFREFVAVIQDDVVPGSGFAVNYSMEDGNARSPSPNSIFFSDCDLSTASTPAPVGDPLTPIFTADPKQRVRFRMVFPGGSVPQVLSVHGHVWQEEPYVSNKEGIPTEIGNNPVSERLGSQQISPNEHIDMVLENAGGAFGVTGDYLYSAFISDYGGLWGLFRVGTPQVMPTCPATQSTSGAAPTRAIPVKKER